MSLSPYHVRPILHDSLLKVLSRFEASKQNPNRLKLCLNYFSARRSFIFPVSLHVSHSSVI